MSETTVRTHAAVRGFQRSAEAYERGRPGYPAAAARLLSPRLGLGPRRTIVELGSGTGKFTRALLPLGGTIVAIEPTAGMRRVFARELPRRPPPARDRGGDPSPRRFRRCGRRRPGVPVVPSSNGAEGDRTRSASGRRVGPRLERPRRIGGWSKQVSRILDRYGRTAASRERLWKAALREQGAPFAAPKKREFSHVQRLSHAEVTDRFLSVSAIAILPAAERWKVANEIRRLLESDPLTRGRATFELPYVTEVYTARLKPRNR